MAGMPTGQRSMDGTFYRRPPCLGIPTVATAAIPRCNADVDDMASVIRRFEAFRAKYACLIE